MSAQLFYWGIIKRLQEGILQKYARRNLIIQLIVLWLIHYIKRNNLQILTILYIKGSI